MANISPDLSSRRYTIANYVIMHGDISVEELADTCGVSVMTIYRDISVLEKAGIVHREHGRIRATASGLHEATAQYRMAQGVEEKKQMGKAAAALIPASASVIIDDSTSAIWAIRQLEQTSGLSVVTNSLLVAQELRERPKNSLFFLGGEYQSWAEATLGPHTISALEKVDADLCLISASGIRGDQLFHPYADVAAVKAKMMQAAAKTILLLDHSKFARRALHRFGSISEVDTVVVDADAPAQKVAQLRENGAKVVVAER
ncbi:alkaline phosphatase [Actinomyces sp. HMSC08A01]|nr:alkaline phosphatase [Actinomyces sp. HMSC08A01]